MEGCGVNDKEKKLYYGHIKLGDMLSVPCPYGAKMKIGSVGCQGCEHFKERDVNDYYVICTKQEKNK